MTTAKKKTAPVVVGGAPGITAPPAGYAPTKKYQHVWTGRVDTGAAWYAEDPTNFIKGLRSKAFVEVRLSKTAAEKKLGKWHPV